MFFFRLAHLPPWSVTPMKEKLSYYNREKQKNPQLGPGNRPIPDRSVLVEEESIPA